MFLVFISQEFSQNYLMCSGTLNLCVFCMMTMNDGIFLGIFPSFLQGIFGLFRLKGSLAHSFRTFFGFFLFRYLLLLLLVLKLLLILRSLCLLCALQSVLFWSLLGSLHRICRLLCYCLDNRVLPCLALGSLLFLLICVLLTSLGLGLLSLMRRLFLLVGLLLFCRIYTNNNCNSNNCIYVLS